MRRLALILSTAALILTGCGAHHEHHAKLWLTHRLGQCVSTDCGPYDVTLNWTLPPYQGTTGYNLLLNGSQVGTASSSPFTFFGMDCGTTDTLGVEAHDGSGNHGPLWTTSYTTPSCPVVGSTVVGTAGSSTPTCTTQVAVNGSVDTALGTGSNEVICLDPGSWSSIHIDESHTGTNNVICARVASGSTCNATQTSTVTVDGFQTGDPDGSGCGTSCSFDHVTVEGLKMTDKFLLAGEMTGSTFQYNTIEGIQGSGGVSGDGATAADFYTDPGYHGQSTDFTNVSISYNQMDDDAECWEDPGGDNITFSHNVCGPNMGLDSEQNWHYIQAEGLNGLTIDNNSFIGPGSPSGQGGGAHVNVLHLWGANDKFDNNILWHVGGFQHLQLNDDGSGSSNLEVKNNLDVEDPSETTGAFEQLDVSAHTDSGFTQATNTVIGVSGETSPDYVVGDGGTPTSCSVSDNLGVGNASGEFSVAAGCTSSSNVSDDGSAPGTGSVPSWTPNWQNTTWTPNNGSPWSAPPSNYYKPVAGGGVTSSMGYQGTIGP